MPLCSRCFTVRPTSEVQRGYRYEITRKVVEVQTALVIAASSNQAAMMANETDWDVASHKPERPRARRDSGEPAGWVCRDQGDCAERRRLSKDAKGNYISEPKQRLPLRT